MDRRISYKIVIDTETCSVDKTLEEVRPFNMWCYDIGWVVCDKRGQVFVSRSYVNKDIFDREQELMNSSYYAWKLPRYHKEIADGTRILASFYEIREQFIEDYEYWNVTEIYAHNMPFDYGALNNTERWLTKSKYRYFFPYNARICDTLRMARDVLGNMPTYLRFCENNEFITSSGKPRFTAEIIHKFLSQDLNFEESHTGLEDVLIEKDIMAYCYKQHKKMRKDCWDKKPNPNYNETWESAY